MSGLVRDARLSAQTDLLVRTINGTRMEAIKQRKNFKVCPAATPDTATVCSTDANDWIKGWLVIEGTTISQRISSKSGVTVSSAALAVEFVGTLGTPTAASSFTICAPTRKQMTVNIAASGRVDKRIDATVCS
ncbi:GspH/FimT family pseudopilin [Undibacterium sp. Ren11W]|uniref:GspH/FimT family pseudopilin n=1 Tax=Undibacterium sp. Ren11W TaxID=3413045 RepID=UPI003BF103A0